MPKAVLFDWDGTLVDSFSFLERAHNHVLANFNLPPLKHGGFRRYFGQPRDWVYSELYGKQAGAAQPLFENYVHENCHRIQPMNGASDLLNFIKSRGLASGVVTNKKNILVAREMKHLGWAPFFPVVVASGDTKHDKPHPGPLLEALEHLNIQAHSENVWYVGDTPLDAQCANNAGCKSVIIQKDLAEPHDFKAIKVDSFFEDCQSLQEKLAAE